MEYILITGACGGMGASTVKAFTDDGFTVFALDRNVRKAEKNVIPLQADITDEQSVKAAFENVAAVTDRLFAIVHFAGIYMLDSLIEISFENFARAFEVNLFGAFLINKTFYPLLKEGSRIVITTSELAPLAPLPFTGIYSITKSVLDKYAYSLRMELQLSGIFVSVLRAGAVKTGMLGVSTEALKIFCQGTKLYTCNAEHFRAIVDGVEAKSISTEKIARKIQKIVKAKAPGFSYHINRNPLLLLLNMLPTRLQLLIIRLILK